MQDSENPPFSYRFILSSAENTLNRVMKIVGGGQNFVPRETAIGHSRLRPMTRPLTRIIVNATINNFVRKGRA